MKASLVDRVMWVGADERVGCGGQLQEYAQHRDAHAHAELRTKEKKIKTKITKIKNKNQTNKNQKSNQQKSHH